MRYASIFFTILVVWVAIITIGGLTGSTDEIYQLYLMTVAFTLALFLFGFTRRK